MWDQQKSGEKKMAVRQCVTAALGLAMTMTMAMGSGLAFGEQDAQAALATADSYTVVVKTVIQHPFGEDSKGSSFGAGFVIDKQRGWILTNAHVASRSPAKITAKFRGGEPVPVIRIYVDPFLDMAILSMAPEALPQGVSEARLECGELPKAGVPVVAYGHPGGHYFTGTKGIISGVSSKYEMELLQTDAPINRGNSGGPLINLSSGRIAGISTASVSGMQNTNFALASSFVCPVVSLMRAGKDPSPPRTDWVFYSGIEESEILKVARAGRFGERFGIQAGDVIVAVNGSARPRNETQLLHAMRGHLDDLHIDVERAGQMIRLHGHAPPEDNVLDKEGVLAAGMLFNEFDERLAGELGVAGVNLAHVERGSAAQVAEVPSGTLLVSVNGQPTPSLEAVQKAFAEAARSTNEAVLVFKKLSSRANSTSIFNWLERKVAISEVRKIRVRDVP